MKLALFFIALLVLPMSAHAAPKGVFYVCDMTSPKKDLNWISDSIGFVFLDDGTVKVLDQWILQFLEEPIPVKQRRTAKADVVRMSWALTDIKTKTGRIIPPTRYRADLNTATKTVKVWATSSSQSSARVTGTGTCTQRKGAPKLR